MSGSSGKIHTVTSIPVGLKNLHGDPEAGASFTHIDHSRIMFDDTLSDPVAAVESGYRLGKVFAAGGQGIIREAVDLDLRRLVAIKTLKTDTGDQFSRGQFIQEARVTAQLSHPSIIPIYSLNTDPSGGLHLAMKLVDGKNLKNYLEQLCLQYRTAGAEQFDERKSLLFRLDIFLHVCDALEYANSRNIMHCDLKPENILIGEFRETYIMDWGIARLIDEPGYDPDKWTRPATISGTPRFLSPEAIQGEHTDQRADIYALGLILFEITTLQEAYVGRSSDEVVSLIREGRMAETRHKFGCKIDADLKAIIAKTTAFDRKNRYQTVKELSTDLRKYLAGEETSANPYHLFGKLSAFAIHHKRLSFAFALVCIVSLIVIFAFTCYRQVTQLDRIQTENRCITQAYSLSSLCANYIETQIAHNAQFLSTLTSEYLFLSGANLDNSQSTAPRFFTTADFAVDSKTAPETFLYSSVYHRKVDFSHFAYKASHTGPFTAEERKRVEILGRLQDSFINVFHNRLPKEAANASPAEQNEYLRLSGIPLHLVLFGFPDGFFAVYPGNGNYSETYDPRLRQWYKTALASDGGFAWTKPYPGNTSSAGYLISCAVPMLDTAGACLGVAGFDLHLNTMIRDLKRSGNTGGNVLEKTLLDSRGFILVSTGGYFASAVKSNKADFLVLPFQDKKLFEQFTALKYNTIHRMENGRDILYCINYLPCQNWYYIEKLDISDSSAPDL